MTPIHVQARPGDVAEIVLLPGDPGRATRVSDRLTAVRCYNEFRGLLGYTGTYNHVAVSVQTTGMGAPSAAIVVEELAMVGAKAVIRIGTCGGVQPEIKAGDLIIATAASPLEGTTRLYVNNDPFAPAATFRVVRALADAAEHTDARCHVGPITTEDALYAVTPGWREAWASRGVLAQEMEASAIFTVAAVRGLEAGCVLTVSNVAGQHERMADDQLQPAIDRMIGVALEAAVALTA